MRTCTLLALMCIAGAVLSSGCDEPMHRPAPAAVPLPAEPAPPADAPQALRHVAAKQQTGSEDALPTGHTPADEVRDEEPPPALPPEFEVFQAILEQYRPAEVSASSPRVDED